MVTVVNLRKERADIPVCRPTAYGNPYIGHERVRDWVIEKFAEFFYSERGRELRQRALVEIPPNAKIGCHCAPLRCHADIIAGYLNWKREVTFDWTDTYD
jgi:hypothetical protein